MIPTVLENNNNEKLFYDLYSKLLTDRIIFLTGEINDEKANIIVSELLYLDSINNDDIFLYINSPGGNVTSGFAIYDTMNYIKSDIKTICIGQCSSMASIILSSGSKGKRYSLKNSEIMIHQPLGGIKGQASDIKITCDHIEYLKDKLNKILAINTKQPLDKIKKDTDRDHYLTSKEALKYGIIDHII